MKAAREADAISKIAESAVFPVAMDAGAQEMRAATERAQAEVAIAGGQSRETPKRERPRLGGIYRLPLFLTGDEQDATDELRASQHWPDAQTKIVALLRQLSIEHGIVNEDAFS